MLKIRVKPSPFRLRISVKYWLFLSLVALPVVFKINLTGKIAVFPQELIVPALIIACLVRSRKIRLPRYITPYSILFFALLTIITATVLSWASVFSVTGVFKIIKYLIYVVAFLLISEYRIPNFEKIFNRVALTSILITLSVYFYNMATFQGNIAEFLAASIWVPEYVPSGLSNVKLNLSSLTFGRDGGSHGVYGTYLVLVFLVNYRYLVDSRVKPVFINYLLCFLTFFNLALLTSRESFLAFSVVHMLFAVSFLMRLRVKKVYLYAFLVFCVGIYVAIVNNISFGVVEKILYTVESISESGTESNINLRVNVWTLILLSYTLYPVYILTGMGYNQENFVRILQDTNLYYNLSLRFPEVPESFFFMFLSYGGIVALLFGILFWLGILFYTYRLCRNSVTGKLFFSLLLLYSSLTIPGLPCCQMYPSCSTRWSIYG